METNNIPRCLLTDSELVEAVHKAVSNMCQRKDWRMSVPVDMNKDSDMIISELCNRFKVTTEFLVPQLLAERDKLNAQLKQADEIIFPLEKLTRTWKQR